jgi:RNA polymerase sigma-70 factor (ECF subfamily)
VERRAEEQLIELAKAGDQSAMVELLQAVEHPIYNTAFYYMKNEYDAKDIAQEAMVRIYTKIDTFKGQAQFKTWAQRITINLCKDHFRSRKENLSIEGAELEIKDKADLEQEITDKLVTEDVIEIIYALPEPMREVLILRYLQEFSYSEIADTLDIPLNTVKSHLFRGRERIYEEYYRGGDQSERMY